MSDKMRLELLEFPNVLEGDKFIKVHSALIGAIKDTLELVSDYRGKLVAAQEVIKQLRKELENARDA